MQIVPLADGSIQIGALTLPVFAARDVAVRILEACGDVPEEAQGRVRCREHLDRVFARSAVVYVRDMQTRATGRFPAIRDGRRLVVRLGDSVTATLLDEGERHRGFAQQWRADPLFGPVAELMEPLGRFSAASVQVRQLQERA